jgi:hypothetical protein
MVVSGCLFGDVCIGYDRHRSMADVGFFFATDIFIHSNYTSQMPVWAFILALAIGLFHVCSLLPFYIGHNISLSLRHSSWDDSSNNQSKD